MLNMGRRRCRACGPVVLSSELHESRNHNPLEACFVVHIHVYSSDDLVAFGYKISFFFSDTFRTKRRAPLAQFSLSHGIVNTIHKLCLMNIYL